MRCTFHSDKGCTFHSATRCTFAPIYSNNQSSYTAAVTSWLQRIGIADLVTSIDKVNVDNSKRSMAIYTLDGKAMGDDVTTLAAGTYIRNGRKFMVR